MRYVRCKSVVYLILVTETLRERERKREKERERKREREREREVYQNAIENIIMEFLCGPFTNINVKY